MKNGWRVVVVGTCGLFAATAFGDVAGIVQSDPVYYEADGMTPTSLENASYAVVDLFVDFSAPNTDGYDNEDSFNLNLFNVNVASYGFDLFNQSDIVAGSWSPGFSLDIPGLSNTNIDSFVTIGGGVGSEPNGAATNGTSLDSSFGSGQPGDIFNTNIGWYAPPTAGQGGVDGLLRVWIGRFVVTGEEARVGSVFSLIGDIGYNYGSNTGAFFAVDHGGVFSFGFVDCNGNGIADLDDIAVGTSNDIDYNNVPDECQADCNGNGYPDTWDIEQGIAEDCNGDLVPDICDAGVLLNVTFDGMPTTGDPLMLQTASLPAPGEGGVVLDVLSFSSFESPARFLYLVFDGVLLDYLFLDGTTCSLHAEALHITTQDWVSAGKDNDRLIEVWASPAVDPADCGEASVQLTVKYLEIPDDCNGNGVWDGCDVADGTSNDVDANGVPDECQLDCDGDGYPDDSAVAEGVVPDCNGNGVPDSCDITDGTSNDVDGNGEPDECRADCNGNGVPDPWEISQGMAEDCNNNIRPDECDIDEQHSTDHDGNEVPDECQDDCDGDGYPDDWAIATGLVADCGGGPWDINEDGVVDALDISILAKECPGYGVSGNCRPDGCDLTDDPALDCDMDGAIDSCAVADGDVPDCNENGVPDSCDIANNDRFDIDGDGIPDSCELAMGDFDLNGCVDGSDLATLLGMWGFPDPPIGDLNGDGTVGGPDLSILLGNWSSCP